MISSIGSKTPTSKFTLPIYLAAIQNKPKLLTIMNVKGIVLSYHECRRIESSLACTYSNFRKENMSTNRTIHELYSDCFSLIKLLISLLSSELKSSLIDLLIFSNNLDCMLLLYDVFISLVFLDSCLSLFLFTLLSFWLLL